MPPQRRSGPSDSGNKSVISNDLKIIGQGLKIISQGTLQVDGEVEGDVAGAEVIIGEQGKVTGTVAAERVIVRGKISGVIRGMTVALQSSARSRATSTTCRSPSSRAPSSTAAAAGRRMPRSSSSISMWRPTARSGTDGPNRQMQPGGRGAATRRFPVGSHGVLGC